MNDTPQGSEQTDASQPDPQDTNPQTPPRYAPPQYAAPQPTQPQYALPQPASSQPTQPRPGPPQYVQPPASSAPPAPPQPPAHHTQYAPPQFTQPQPQFAQPQPQPQPQQPFYPQLPAQGYPAYQAHPAYATAITPGPGEPFDGAATPDDLTRPLYGATIGQALTRFFKNYASFSGRASRSEYWWVALVFGGGWFLLSLFVNLLDSMTYSMSNGVTPFLQELGGVTLFFAGLGVLIPSIALTWRRLHDANLAGPFFFLGLLFPIGGIVIIILTALPPKVEGRRFFRSR